MRRYLPYHLDNAGICGYVSIERNGGRFFQEMPERRQICVVRVAVDRQINLYLPVMGVTDSLDKFCCREIACQVTEPEGLSSKINGVSAIMDGDPQFFHISGRGKKFRFFHGLSGQIGYPRNFRA